MSKEVELAVIDAELVPRELPAGYWYCGRCSSLIPVTFWHTCDDTRTHSAPSRGRQGEIRERY